jgi:hypothetical protein
MGEAAGAAADLSLGSGKRCREVDVTELQRRLEASGAFLGRSE